MLHYLLLFFICCFGLNAFAQSGCTTSAGAVYGSPTTNERGYCVVPTASNDGVYVAGFREDSILLMRVNLNGIVLWSITFDIVANAEEHIFSMIMDSDGMLVGVGTAGDEISGGTDVAFRFDPNTLQLIWAHEYVGVLPRNYGEVIVQLGSGNFVIANNAVMANTDNDLELLWLNKGTGNIIPGFSRNYHLGGSERFNDMIYYGNFIYGVGRYTDGVSNDKMRHTLVKLDPTTGNHVWAKLGHIPDSQSARLYGMDIVIDQDEIYTIYHGDPTGVSTTNTKVYIQKSTIDGDLLWLKQYELTGNNDVCYELIKSDNGYVVLAGKKSAPSDLILFKIDAAGIVLWAKRYPFPNLTSPQVRDGAAQMCEVGGMLVFTGYGNGAGGTTDIILVRTDLNGETNIPCVDDQNITIPVTTVANPSFYNRAITEFNVSLIDHNESPEILATAVLPMCTITDTLVSLVDTTICDGESYEGYSVAGTFEDFFTTSDGCDSLRILNLDVVFTSSSFEQATICLGDAYEGYTITGTYVDTFQTARGCDSVRTLELIVADILVASIQVGICFGQSFEGYTLPGIYVDTFKSQFGCDSARQLTLQIEEPEKHIMAEICAGQKFEQYTISGIYFDTLLGINGECDTLRELNLIVDPAQIIETHEVICDGESYLGYSQSGIYLDTLTTSDGCDSIRELHLQTMDPITNTIESSICEQMLTDFSQPGVYIDTLVSFEGCDSIVQYVIDDAGLFIPNVFSPNDDGINDVFTIFPFPVRELQINYFGIFDRFGDMVYETKKWPIEWKGKNKAGKPFNPAVFAYVLIYTCSTNHVVQHGNITLVK